MKRLLTVLALAACLPLAACEKSKPEVKPAPQSETSTKAAAEAPAKTAKVAVEKAPAAEPLKIAYSDWPGWVAWEIGIQKGWFKEEGVAVDF
ncbi:MAG: hypothetical protein RJA70_1876, partial [Pseudomonadota bacterium]